jgi:carbamoyl-phosphate synthase small subunit
MFHKFYTLTHELYLKPKIQNINSLKNLKKIDSNAILVLQNGKFFKGMGLGYQGTATGEVCFNTSITGYQEIISDPSYAEQIINFTFPHVGNVGTNKEDHESDKIWTKGVIINTEITEPSNYRSLNRLDKWLKKNKIVGITGIDTRNLTNTIRDKGAPKGTISFSKKGKFNIKNLLSNTQKWNGLKNLDLAKKVSTKKWYVWKDLKTWKKKDGFIKNKKKNFHVVAIDYGIKKNILRYFSEFNCKVTVVSCETNAKDIYKLKPDGIFLSNGPGDPAATGKYAIPIIKDLIKKNIPIFGICLGHQILALTLGAKTRKMNLGHRGANHPVKNLIKGNVEITSQNHGFEVVKSSLSKNIQITHQSLFDNSIEGIRLKNKPVFSVQYHPESNPGPQDSVYLFEEFLGSVKKYAKKKRS